MSDWRGDLRKMQTDLADTVRYTLFPDQNPLNLNDCLGRHLSAVVHWRDSLRCL
jgi:hypothetical protein